MLKSIFKAYDIRGRYPSEINEEVVGAITQALANYFKSKVKSQKSKVLIVIGHDARLSSFALYKSVLHSLKIATAFGGVSPEAWKNLKLKIVSVGMITTSMLYFLVNHFKAVGGIMITASHNPPEYNGLKVVKAKAEPMSGAEIWRIMNHE